MKHINKKLIIGGLATAFLAGSFAVYGQMPVPAGTSTRRDLREKVQTIREEAKMKERSARQEVKMSAQNFRKELEAKRLELEQQLKVKREEARKKIEAAHEEARERIKTEREEFRKRLMALRDERKKAIAERLVDRLNRLNERWTTHFTNVLNRLEDILGKIQLRADKAASLGKDVSAAKTAIDAAKAAIANARTAVEAQAKKTYTVTFTSEGELHTAFRAAKDQLHKDLTALRDGAVRAAREAVHQAARALSRIPRVDEEPTGTSTPPVSTSTPSQ